MDPKAKDKLVFDDCNIYTGGTHSSATSAVTEPDIGTKSADMPPPPAIDESKSDFYGLPSSPLSIFHTGPAWKLPTGPQAQRIPKEARPVCSHAIAPVWDRLGKKIYEHFDSVGLKWTSIDPVRFAEVRRLPGPLFLWVGVMPNTLSRDDAEVAAGRCKDILAEYEIFDVEIAFRESVFTRFTGPQLLDHTSPVHDPTANVRSLFTPTLGLQIARLAFPHCEGTGCLYLRESSDSDRVLLLTARHVVLPPSEHPNHLYHRKANNTPCLKVIHLGSKAYQDALEALVRNIEHETIMIKLFKKRISNLELGTENKDAVKTTRRQALEKQLAKAETTKASTNELHTDITKHWSLQSQRTLGCVLYAPPISVSTDERNFTEDWALVELDRPKFDWNTFPGNVIDLGAFRLSH